MRWFWTLRAQSIYLMKGAITSRAHPFRIQLSSSTLDSLYWSPFDNGSIGGHFQIKSKVGLPQKWTPHTIDFSRSWTLFYHNRHIMRKFYSRKSGMDDPWLKTRGVGRARYWPVFWGQCWASGLKAVFTWRPMYQSLSLCVKETKVPALLDHECVCKGLTPLISKCINIELIWH